MGAYSATQLERILVKLATIDALTASGAIEDWWNNSIYKDRIGDVIDLTVNPGVLKPDVVGASALADGSIIYDHLSLGVMNWSFVESNPTGSASTDTYKSYPRIFTARGAHYIPLYNKGVKQAIVGTTGQYYNMVDGVAQIAGFPLTAALTGEGIPIPAEFIYDNTLRIPRYPTLRFDLLVSGYELSGGGAFTLTSMNMLFILAYHDRAGVTLPIKTLYLDSGNKYYNASWTIEPETITNADTDNDFCGYWLAGEFNLDQITGGSRLLSDDMDNHLGTMNVSNFPDTSEQTMPLPSAGHPLLSTIGLFGTFMLFPIITIVATGLDEIYVERQSYTLVNKVIGNNGWAVGERYVGDAF